MQLQQIMNLATAAQDDRAPLPRAMLVFAHADDETLALGGRLRRFRTALLVHATDSAPRNAQDSKAHGFESVAEYRKARSEELDRALGLAGLSQLSRTCLDVPDQEACLQLVQLTGSIDRPLQEWQPEVLFTHPYEGGHPDHDACAFAVHHAVAMQKKRDDRVPIVVEAAFYHAGPEGIVTGSFLPNPQSTAQVEYLLSSEERKSKQALLACFTSQQETLRYFSAECERFRIAPEYDFGRPAHTPPVFYESFPWGMSSQRFCDLAREAERQLQEEALPACS